MFKDMSEVVWWSLFIRTLLQIPVHNIAATALESVVSGWTGSRLSLDIGAMSSTRLHNDCEAEIN